MSLHSSSLGYVYGTLGHTGTLLSLFFPFYYHLQVPPASDAWHGTSVAARTSAALHGVGVAIADFA